MDPAPATSNILLDTTADERRTAELHNRIARGNVEDSAVSVLIVLPIGVAALAVLYPGLAPVLFWLSGGVVAYLDWRRLCDKFGQTALDQNRVYWWTVFFFPPWYIWKRQEFLGRTLLPVALWSLIIALCFVLFYFTRPITVDTAATESTIANEIQTRFPDLANISQYTVDCPDNMDSREDTAFDCNVMNAKGNVVAAVPVTIDLAGKETDINYLPLSSLLAEQYADATGHVKGKHNLPVPVHTTG